MERCAVFLDIDNTLYWHGDIPERNVRAIERAQKEGHLFFINTGRGYAHLPPVIMEKLHLDGYVCALGTYVRVGEQELVNVTLERRVWLRVAEMLFETGIVGRLQGPDKVYHVLKADTADGPCVTDIAELERDHDFVCNKITFDTPAPEWCLEELKDELEICRHPGYTEAGRKGITKATGMDAVCRHFHVPRERCIAMGDSRNDLEMLQYAGVPVAMGDGEKEIRELCRYVTCPCAEGGVGEFVEQYLLNA